MRGEGGRRNNGLAQKLAPDRALKTNLAQSLSLRKRISDSDSNSNSNSSNIQCRENQHRHIFTSYRASTRACSPRARRGPSRARSHRASRTTAVPSNTRRILSASQGCTRGDEVEVEWDDDKGEEDDEEPEKACQNALPRRCVSVCEAIDASAACCGVGDDDDDAEVEAELSLGVEGGVGYVDAKEDVSMCLPLREAELRMAAVEEK